MQALRRLVEGSRRRLARRHTLGGKAQRCAHAAVCRIPGAMRHQVQALGRGEWEVKLLRGGHQSGGGAGRDGGAADRKRHRRRQHAYR